MRRRTEHYRAQENAVYSVAFSPDSNDPGPPASYRTRPAVGPKTGQEQAALTGHPTGWDSVAYTPAGQTLISRVGPDYRGEGPRRRGRPAKVPGGLTTPPWAVAQPGRYDLRSPSTRRRHGGGPRRQGAGHPQRAHGPGEGVGFQPRRQDAGLGELGQDDQKTVGTCPPPSRRTRATWRTCRAHGWRSPWLSTERNEPRRSSSKPRCLFTATASG